VGTGALGLLLSTVLQLAATCAIEQPLYVGICLRIVALNLATTAESGAFVHKRTRDVPPES
jgi:hypothetical protein